MSVDVYVMVYNEELILPYFLRHYGSFARKIFAFEDCSTDKSREILLSHPKVQIIEPQEHGINEKYWTEVLWPHYETHSRYEVDWVMQVDADEFIYHPNMLAALEQEKSVGTQMIFCKGYTMVSDDIPSTYNQIYDEIKLGLPDRWSSKWALFDPNIHLRFGKGRHYVAETDATVRNSHNDFKILHYRYLGAKYFGERDKRNIDSYNRSEHAGFVYSPTKRRNLPDSTRGVALDWFAENKRKAVNVVDT